jgi:xylulokinase
MATQYLIGVDIGTQGTKAALFTERGRCRAVAFEKSRLRRPAPGVVEEDPERQTASVCRTIKRCVNEAGISTRAVAAIAIDGQMAGILGVGKDGRCVTPYDSWLDTRCAPHIERMRKRARDEVMQKTGCAPSINHGPKILWWKHERRRVYRSIRAFVQPGGYAAMRLCGLEGDAAFIDKTYLHFSGFVDNRRARWDEALCKTYGVEMSKLPRIVEPTAVIGHVIPSMARRCGLSVGVPVAAGCGDTAASFLACGATRSGICVDVAGTASVFAATTDRFRPDLKNHTLGCGRSVTPGLWHPYAYINGGGMNLEWFASRIAGDTGGRSHAAFERLDAEAGRVVPTDDAPMFVPHLGGRVSPSQPNLRGAWVGLRWNHGRGDLFRAMLEGVALEYGIYRRCLLSLYRGFRFHELRITGGGAKSDLWNGIKADVLGCPVVQIARSEGAPMGAALLAGYAVGFFESLPDAADLWIRTGKVHRPDRAAIPYHRRRLRRYESLLAKMNQWSRTDDG